MKKGLLVVCGATGGGRKGKKGEERGGKGRKEEEKGNMGRNGKKVEKGEGGGELHMEEKEVTDDMAELS